jgi:hypothetical protein
MGSPPALTDEQRRLALKKAVANRRRRAEVKRALKDGNMTLAEALALASRDDAIARMRAVELVESLPALGKVKAQRVMHAVGIADSRRFQGLGAHQRADLLRAVIR